eukprot:XP_025006891.1 golgin subfamily B member 1 isoform X3 [Gallus gallus]
MLISSRGIQTSVIGHHAPSGQRLLRAARGRCNTDVPRGRGSLPRRALRGRAEAEAEEVVAPRGPGAARPPTGTRSHLETMWKWGSGDDSPSKAVAAGSQDARNMSVTDLTEQLASTEQLVIQLKELVREKDAELRNKDHQLKEEKESADAKLSKVKLQNKAKVASLTSQLEELKKQLSASGGSEEKAEPKKASRDGDQENAAANRGKILVLRKRIEELESQITQKNEELQKKDAELEAQRYRGTEMDAMLAEKEKKLAERDAYIIDLQIACGSGGVTNEVLLPNEELKNELSIKESSLQSMQILVQQLNKKVGDSEEKCSLFQEEIESLKNVQSNERKRFQKMEATYIENVRVLQNIIHEKEKELEAQGRKHEQELFKLAAKCDASADLEQLLKALKQKLHEKEEVMLGRTQVIDVLQKELDAKDQELKEINENMKRLQSEKENLQSKLDAERHVLRAQIKDMMEKHMLEMTKVREKYNAELHEIQEKHETELQEKDQALFQLKKQVAELTSSGQTNSKDVADLESTSKEKMEELEVQLKLKTEEAGKSEAKFLKMKAWSKSRIKQLEDELKSFSSKNNDLSALNNRVSELEVEKEELELKLQSLQEIKTQNEELLTKLEIYEEQQRKLQADLDQVTKRAASQASESGSVDELQSQLLEWQENVPESEESRDRVREEKSAMALRMAQIEEEREGLIEDDWFFPGCSDPAIVSGQQELEEELTTVQGMGRLDQAGGKSNQTNRNIQEEYSFDRKQCFQEALNVTLDSTDSAEGENMGGWWPEYTSPNAGLRSVVEELELERNQLQEQILFLEERCHDLEDRLQLQGRMEALQNENERFQSQLTQLHNQQIRDAEKHQILISGLNEQLKGLSDRNSFLETSLGEKEEKLLSLTEKLEQIETFRKQLQERDLLNKELGEKFMHSEQKLKEALKKCSAYEVENTEQKKIISDLTEKVATLKEKTLKQDGMVESMQLDLDQTNEELDKLNTSHLEERSQLIQDLQKREREIDHLKEALAEKDRELSALSLNMTEYSEQVIILKHQVQCKNEEIRGIEEALSKAEREADLLKEVQTADVRDTSVKISVLSEKSNTMRLELERIRVENEAKTKENEELIKQISEYSITVKDLRSEIKANHVAYHNHLMECESQITLLKEQISKSSEKLQETENKQRKEAEYLKSQIEENNTLKEKWNSLLKEKENKEQTLENELKSIKDTYNKLVLEDAKKDEELAQLSRKLIEHAEHQETIKKELQEKQEIIISLDKKLEFLEQQNEETKLKLAEDLKVKETCCKELNNQLSEIQKQISKMEIETQEKASANKQLQADLEGKEIRLAEQVKANEHLKKSMDRVKKEKQQLVSENENLSKLLDVKECELLKKIQAVAEIESKLSVSDAEYQKTLSVLNCEKSTLAKEIEQLSIAAKQKENSVAEQLQKKTKECNLLAGQLFESKEQAQQLREQMKSVLIQLKDATDKETKKEEMLNNTVTVDQIADEIENLCRTFVTRELEISKLSSECGNYVQQIEAFSKAMASLQDDRDKLLQELSKQKVASETKQGGTASFPIACNSINDINYFKSNLDVPQIDRERLAKEGASLAAVEISKLKAKVDDLEKALHQTKAFQAETEREIASYQSELAGLRMEKNLLLSESQALQNQYQMTVAEKDRQIAELQKLQEDIIVNKSVSTGNVYPVKALETASLAGGADTPEEVKHVLAERNQLQNELQRCLQEMHQKDLHLHQINSKNVQSAEENAVLSAQLKTLSQTLRDNQLRYTDLQNRYLRLEREYQTMQVTSFQGTIQDETRAEVPPGAPQERSAVIVEIDNMELNELRKRLADTEQQYDSVQQALSQLTQTLAEEKRRREAAEEALGLSEELSNRFEVSSYRSVPSEYTIRMETEEEREALIINPSEHVTVRKVKRGALSFRRWLRGRSLTCSKLLTSRAKSRYLFLTYLVTLHLIVLLCLTGVL